MLIDPKKTGSVFRNAFPTSSIIWENERIGSRGHKQRLMTDQQAAKLSQSIVHR